MPKATKPTTTPPPPLSGEGALAGMGIEPEPDDATDHRLLERTDKVIDALYKATKLSHALSFMTENSIGDNPSRADTFRVSIAALNGCLGDLIDLALENSELLDQALRVGVQL